MTEIPNHMLSPQELKDLEKKGALDKLLREVDERYIERAQLPSKWFGYLLGVLAVAIFIDITGWIAAFMNGGLYYLMATLLQATETICIVGMAGLGIHGTIQVYKQEQEKKQVALDFEANWAEG